LEDVMAVINDGRPVIDDGRRSVVGRTITTPAAPSRESVAARYVMAVLRIVVGWTFLWAFLDKLFGLGYATPEARSWLNGGSPTKGFLSSATGAFAGFYHDIAGTGWANWLFMIGLAAIGTALILGIGTRIAGVTGAILYLMMFTVVLPPENNPVVDEHIIGALVMVLLALSAPGDTLGVGRWWKSLTVVQRNPWLI
jgi:thiosulfate dehydrogenase (quinone) large subunit